MNDKKDIFELITQIEKIILKAKDLEKKYKSHLQSINPKYTESALNLIHYLALRSFDLSTLQSRLSKYGLQDLSNIESHVLLSLFKIKTLLEIE